MVMAGLAGSLEELESFPSILIAGERDLRKIWYVGLRVPGTPAPSPFDRLAGS